MRRIGRFGAPLALMGLIWFLSDQSDLSSGLGTIDLIGRKLIHMGEYALLCVLWWRALGVRAAPWAALIALAWAALDEWHQSNVPGRHGTPVDVVIDSAGIAAALLVLRARPRLRARLLAA